ncbi:MAG: hypothetical protein SVC26_02545 [Pseudomonadota bacterium]|nr:hypothetical protein [Pseudomonadota bacterium]
MTTIFENFNSDAGWTNFSGTDDYNPNSFFFGGTLLAISSQVTNDLDEHVAKKNITSPLNLTQSGRISIEIILERSTPSQDGAFVVQADNFEFFAVGVSLQGAGNAVICYGDVYTFPDVQEQALVKYEMIVTNGNYVTSQFVDGALNHQVSGSASSCTLEHYRFSVNKNGSGGETRYQNFYISDTDVFDEPEPINIETAVFHPDQYKLSETISFKTAINRAESGAEYRTALYPYPDRVWQFTASNDQLSMFNFQQGRLSDWYVPAMQLAEAIDVAQGATNVPFDHFGYVYLTNGVNNQLTTISGNTLTDAATHDFTHVAPVYVGNLIENPVMRHNALYARNSVQFRMQIYEDLEFTPEHTYQGDEVFTECTLLQGMSTTEYSQEIGVNATINNYFDIHADTQSTQFKRPIKLLYYRKQLKSRYSWLFDKQGRYKPFWYPSFGNEFEGFSVAVQVITVPKTHVPKHVAIEKEGAWTFYAVTVNELESTLELTLDALPPAEPFNLYRLDHVRLDSDSVTIEHGYTFALDLTITELP